MKILVCLKYVPDLETMDVTDFLPHKSEDGEWGDVAGRMNRYDEYAVEAALRLKERFGASRIDAVTVGTRRAAEVLRRALGMGVGHGVHILQACQVFPSPFTIGGLIAAYAHEHAYDLILCGAMSEDLMQGQVGPVIAGLLERPCLTTVHTLGYSAGTDCLRCEREAEGGRQEIFEVALPALVSIQSGILPPRYPALSKLLRANRYPLEEITAESQGDILERQHVAAARRPVKTREGIILNGSADEKGRALAALLRARGRL